MKSKNRRTIKIIVGILVVLVVCTGIFLYVAIFRGFYASSDIPAGEYTGSANVEFLGGKEIYRVVQINMVSQFLKIPQVRLMKRLQIMEMRYI